MDFSTIAALVAAHKWIAVASFMIGVGVRFTKSDSPLPDWMHVTPRARVWIAIIGGIIASALDKVLSGDPWDEALISGLLAAMTAIVGHETVVESMRNGREFFEPKYPPPSPPTDSTVHPPPGDPPPTTMRMAFVFGAAAAFLVLLSGCGAWLQKHPNVGPEAAKTAICILDHITDPIPVIMAECEGATEILVHDVASAQKRAMAKIALASRDGGAP